MSAGTCDASASRAPIPSSPPSSRPASCAIARAWIASTFARCAARDSPRSSGRNVGSSHGLRGPRQATVEGRGRASGSSGAGTRSRGGADTGGYRFAAPFFVEAFAGFAAAVFLAVFAAVALVGFPTASATVRCVTTVRALSGHHFGSGISANATRA